MISLSSDDIRIVSSIVNWRLNVDGELLSKYDMNDDDSQILRILLNELGCQQRACQFGLDSILIEIGDRYSCLDGRMQLTSGHLQLIKIAIHQFVGELQHSPVEIEVVTGFPAARTLELLSRI